MYQIPEGWWLRSIDGDPSGKEWDVILAQKGPPWKQVIGQANENVGSPTVALAFCLAILKAERK